MVRASEWASARARWQSNQWILTMHTLTHTQTEFSINVHNESERQALSYRALNRVENGMMHIPF